MIKKIVFFCIFNDYTNTVGIMRCKRKSTQPRVERSGTLGYVLLRLQRDNYLHELQN